MVFLSPEYITFLLPYIAMSFWSLSRTLGEVGKGGGGGGGGGILAAATLNLNYLFNVWANALKLQDIFRNLADENLIWSVSVLWSSRYHDNEFLKWKLKSIFTWN